MRSVGEVEQHLISAGCFEVMDGVMTRLDGEHPNPCRTRTGDIVRRVPNDHGSLEHLRGQLSLACAAHRDATQVIATRRLFAKRPPTEVIGESEVRELDLCGRLLVAREQRKVKRFAPVHGDEQLLDTGHHTVTS